MALMKRKKGHYSISAVARMFSVHQQTIRLYEKEGLITPKRSSGNTRLFSEEDIDRLEEIIYLTHQLGINLAGVEMILKLKKQMAKMQKEMNKLFDDTQKELDDNITHSKQVATESAKQLLKLKNKVKALPGNAPVEHPHSVFNKTSPETSPSDSENESDSWEIEYDE